MPLEINRGFLISVSLQYLLDSCSYLLAAKIDNDEKLYTCFYAWKLKGVKQGMLDNAFGNVSNSRGRVWYSEGASDHSF